MATPIPVEGNAPVPTDNGGVVPVPTAAPPGLKLPGARASSSTSATPPPINATQVGPRPVMPVTWQETSMLMAQLLEIAATGGTDSFDRAKDFFEAELAKIRAGQ